MSINRRLARSIALQVLFELDLNQKLNLNQEDLKSMIDRETLEFASTSDDGFVLDLVTDIQARLATLDEIISKAAPEWPIDKINTIDRNILRLGLTELLFHSETVPPKVAIDESIELAKKYSGVAAHKFINGVLGAIYKEMGEPRKEEVSQKKTDLETLSLVGGLVYAILEGKIFLAFVKDIFKHWTLPKGQLLAGEDTRVGAIRKIKEEIGLETVIKDKLLENTYIANLKAEALDDGLAEKLATYKPKEKIKKHVVYFLAEGEYGPLKLEKDKTGLVEAKWFTLDQVEELNVYDDIKPILTIGVNKIIKNYGD